MVLGKCQTIVLDVIHPNFKNEIKAEALIPNTSGQGVVDNAVVVLVDGLFAQLAQLPFPLLQLALALQVIDHKGEVDVAVQIRIGNPGLVDALSASHGDDDGLHALTFLSLPLE